MLKQNGPSIGVASPIPKLLVFVLPILFKSTVNNPELQTPHLVNYSSMCRWRAFPEW